MPRPKWKAIAIGLMKEMYPVMMRRPPTITVICEGCGHATRHCLQQNFFPQRTLEELEKRGILKAPKS